MMKNLRPEEEKIITNIRNLLRLKRNKGTKDNKNREIKNLL